MPSPNPHSAVSLRSHPVHAMLVPVPLVCFGLTWVSDIVYWQTAAMQWANVSAWLLTIGLIGAVIAVLAGIVDYSSDLRIRRLRAARIHLFGNVAALVLTIFNALIHTRDAYTSVVPVGLILSTLVVAILAITGWNGWSLVHRHRVGIEDVRS